MTDPLDIEASRRICDAATDGPWERRDTVTVRRGGEPELRIGCAQDDAHQIADLTFVAHARTALPQALDEIERLRTELDAASEECQRHQVGESYAVGHEYGSAVAVKYRNERDALQARIDAALARHFPADAPTNCGIFRIVFCNECDWRWPCPTVAALEGTVTE